MNMKTSSDVLREAADVISEHGWTQGLLSDESGSHCALGAMLVVTRHGAHGDFGAAATVLIKHLDGIGPKHAGITDWNDAPERTAEDVILALKRAAEET